MVERTEVDRSGRFVQEVMIQESAKRGLAPDLVWRRGTVGIFVTEWDRVSDPLVRAMLVMVSLNLLEDVFEMRFADQNEVVESFTALADKTFSKGVALGCAGRRLDDPDAVGLEYVVERQEGRIAVVDEKPDLAKWFVHRHAKVPRLLAHPLAVRMRRASCDADASGLQVNKEQDVESRKSGAGPDFLGEEVRGPGDVHVRLNKVFPRHSFAMRGRRQPVSFEHVANMRRRHRVSQLLQFADDTHVTPGVILRQFDDQRRRSVLFRRTSDLVAPTREIPLPALYYAVPRQERLRRDDGDDISQSILDAHTVLDEQAPVSIGQARPFVWKEFPQHAVLRTQKIVLCRQVAPKEFVDLGDESFRSNVHRENMPFLIS